MIDSHVHFWRLNRGEYSWITDDRPILRQDYLPEDFNSIIAKTKVTGCIAIQATPTEGDTDYLLSCAQDHAIIQGVIGWTDLKAPNIETNLERWQNNGTLKGIRPAEGVQTGPDWLDESYEVGLHALTKRQLILEALALPKHLNGIAKIAGIHDDLNIVINHAAKPDADNLHQWSKDITAFASQENVVCKLSGLTQQSSDSSHHAQVYDVLLETFGPARLMWGSDFPVLMETANYESWLRTTQQLLESLSEDELEQVGSGTAQRIYQLNQEL